MRSYYRERYRTRMDEAIQSLGGSCTKCGAKDRLQLDHIDPDTKEFEITACWSYSEERFQQEVAKCQVLCANCHKSKTLADRGHQQAIGHHGTPSCYRYCRCAICKAAKAAYQRSYYEKNRERLLEKKRLRDISARSSSR